MYSVGRRTKRWPLCLFFNFLDVVAINSAVIYKAVKQDCGMARKYFIKQLALQLMRYALNMRNKAKHLSRDLQVLIQKHAGTLSFEDALEASDLSKSLYSYAQVRSALVSMELPLVNVSTCELRSVIRFFTAKNETAVNIHRNLVSVYGEGCMSIQMVRRWRSWFLEGRQNVHDDERSDRPVTATDNAAVAAVRNVVEANRRVTIDEIMIRLPPGIEIGCSSIGTIMSVVLNLN
ncbi:hypothetical protein LAZ67_4001359 [Cordylochernes scorpioides]|uniref:Mos1 transposase HTH domain-containing protein n=1 Tax=Cordylochernes scorpioides TaxID=51811 RepID=A0ABY6KCX7_9ARAC|nr:hypothetical protein LAZ67_4001359 [Cordylochernes scorpioides]